MNYFASLIFFLRQERYVGWDAEVTKSLRLLSFRMTQHLHGDQVICHVGLKSDSFWGILLSEQFFYQKNYHLNVYKNLERLTYLLPE